jgi:hypothetical protein
LDPPANATDLQVKQWNQVDEYHAFGYEWLKTQLPPTDQALIQANIGNFPNMAAIFEHLDLQYGHGLHQDRTDTAVLEDAISPIDPDDISPADTQFTKYENVMHQLSPAQQLIYANHSNRIQHFLQKLNASQSSCVMNAIIADPNTRTAADRTFENFRIVASAALDNLHNDPIIRKHFDAINYANSAAATWINNHTAENQPSAAAAADDEEFLADRAAGRPPRSQPSPWCFTCNEHHNPKDCRQIIQLIKNNAGFEPVLRFALDRASKVYLVAKGEFLPQTITVSPGFGKNTTRVSFIIANSTTGGGKQDRYEDKRGGDRGGGRGGGGRGNGRNYRKN